MKHLYISLILTACASFPSFALHPEAPQAPQLSDSVAILREQVAHLQSEVEAAEARSDSMDNILQTRVDENARLLESGRKTASEQIRTVETKAKTERDRLALWGIWAIVALLIVAIAVYLILHRDIMKGSDAITVIRDAQGRLEEESVKLDTKLIELLEKQLQAESRRTAAAQPAAPDHSLALKLANEVARIEKNLTRMGSDVKGYKPLMKGVERIKNNFRDNGYEIETYLGQPYNDGMRVEADFVTDDNLPAGAQVITGVAKPQVHYKSTLLQKAVVTVSQNI